MIKSKFNHIGILVSDINKAFEFYTKALDLEVVMKPTLVKEENKTAIGKMCIQVFGTGWKEFNIAHLATNDGIGVELFEMKNKEGNKHNVNFNKIGIFHFCLETDDFEDVIKKVEKYGGKKRMNEMRYHPNNNKKTQKMIYLEDPDGNLFELYSHSYKKTYSSEYE